ncbi:unnamed protein product [Prorocentrum cordatum]|uniref:Uncharacterized protein n=1 Tax=Prorocentrum cordatum TaxID=2364126 RepID=A0ABN9V666_9DINO|nr:unnamed protein product [Polarella glacialis]
MTLVARGQDLLAFALPRSGIEGAAPERSWPLSGATLRAAAAEAEAADSSQPAPFGFEAQDLYSGERWRFVCGSYVEQCAWLSCFGGCREPRPGLPMAAEGPPMGAPRRAAHAAGAEGAVAAVPFCGAGEIEGALGPLAGRPRCRAVPVRCERSELERGRQRAPAASGGPRGERERRRQRAEVSCARGGGRAAAAGVGQRRERRGN